MKKRLIALVLLLLAFSGFAQQGPGINKYLNIKLEAMVLDSLSREPL